MSAKMSVIYVPDTGHAVAAVSRTSDPTVAFDLTRLGGDSVIVKNANAVTGGSSSGEELNVPSSVLKVTKQPIDLDEGLLFMPLTYALDHDTPQEIGNPFPTAVGLTVALNNDHIHLSGTLVPGADLPVWTLVEEKPPISGTAPEMRISTGKLPKGGPLVDIQLTGSPGGTPISLPTGRTYYLLFLIAGYQPFFTTQSI